MKVIIRGIFVLALLAFSVGTVIAAGQSLIPEQSANFLVSSIIVREPISGGCMVLAVDEEMKKIRSLLPAVKKVKFDD